jgi:hypothetical protein
MLCNISDIQTVFRNHNFKPSLDETQMTGILPPDNQIQKIDQSYQSEKRIQILWKSK